MFEHIKGTVPAPLSPSEWVDRRPTHADDAERRTTWLQGRRVGAVVAMVNMVGAVIGSGVLGLPYIAAQSGYLLFFVLLTATAVITNYGGELLIACCLTSGALSYEAVAEEAFGKWGRRVFCVVTMYTTLGYLTSYVRTFDDIAGGLLSSSSSVGPHTVTVLVVALGCLPIACLPRISHMAWASLTAHACYVFFLGFLVVHAVTQRGAVALPDADSSDEGACTSGGCEEFRLFAPTLHTFLAIPTMCYSFTANIAMIPIYHEMTQADALGRTRRGSKARVAGLLRLALFISWAVYAAVAAAGYALFRGWTKQNILSNLADWDSDAPANLAVRGMFGLSVLHSIPIFGFPFRRAFFTLVDPSGPFAAPGIARCAAAPGGEAAAAAAGGAACAATPIPSPASSGPVPTTSHPSGDTSVGPLHDGGDDSDAPPERRGGGGDAEVPLLSTGGVSGSEEEGVSAGRWALHAALTCGLLGAGLVLGMAVPHITTVFGIVGSVGSVCLCMLFPASFYLRVCLSAANEAALRDRGSLLAAEQVPLKAEVPLPALPPASPACAARAAPVAMIVLGAAVFVVSWIGLVYTWVTDGFQ